MHPHPGWVEMDPEELWTTVLSVGKEAIEGAEVTAKDLACMGLSTQRSTFITWSRSTGLPFHNFISWKDTRADAICRNFNTHPLLKAFKTFSKVLYTVTRHSRFLLASIVEAQNTFTCMKLKWVLDNIPGVRKALDSGDLMVGTIDSWLLYKLTGGQVHVTDGGNASATGLYDIFTSDYIHLFINYFIGVPAASLPMVVDSASPDAFGSTEASIFGSSVPIRACFADQAASVFGLGCLNQSDMKMTLGTGSFFDCCTGSEIHASIGGLNPVMAWKLGRKKVYLAEGSQYQTSQVIEWATNMGNSCLCLIHSLILDCIVRGNPVLRRWQCCQQEPLYAFVFNMNE